jgi:RND family efflux transporter MFP subunit
MKINNRQSAIINGSRSFDLILRITLPVLILALTPLLSGCGRSHSPGTSAATDLPPASVRLETIQPRRLPITEDVIGTVRSRHAVDIAAKISGRIVELPVVLGQMVKQGDLLVAMDSQEIQARLEQAEVALHQAEIDYRRVETLRRTGAATQSENDTATSRFHSTRAAVAEARAMLDYARVTAPISGVIARKDTDLGDLAMPGQLLLRLEDPLNLRIEADVPGSLLDRVKPGATLTVRVESVSASLEGKVIEIAPVADPATRSSRVKLDLPQTPGLRPGQFGRVAVPLAEAEFLIVPSTAMVQRGQLDILFVAVDGKAQMRIVRAGRALGEGVEILAGLSAGESVVVDHVADLLDGQPLAPR